jgi:hypothetical protein
MVICNANKVAFYHFLPLTLFYILNLAGFFLFRLFNLRGSRYAVKMWIRIRICHADLIGSESETLVILVQICQNAGTTMLINAFSNFFYIFCKNVLAD